MRTQLCIQTFLVLFYLVLFAVGTLLVSGHCQIDQQSILIQFKNELNYDPLLSRKLVSWSPNITTDCCKWKGVDCSITGQVIGLDLSNETISGGIDDPSVLFNLKYIQRLNLAANNFNFSQIPSRIGQFASLLYLNLSNSVFSGQIPGELSHLKSLEILDLSEYFSYGNRSLKLENPNLATLVQNLTRLTGLYLDNVNISSQRFDWCQGLSSSLPNLEVLSFSNCDLSGPLDQSLEKLQSLSVIDLALNNLSAPVPDFFASFKNLTVMNLASCNLIGTFPEKLLQLQRLQILDLSVNTNLHGSLPDFPMNGSLKSLVLRETNFLGVIPKSIGNLKNLSRLKLQWSNFSGQIPNSMETLTQLVYLDLSSNSFTGEIPSFQQCKNLMHIDLARNGLSGMIPSAHFEGLPNLVFVDLRFNGFKGSIPSSLFSLQVVQGILLANNYFGGLIPNFTNPSLSSLDTLDLSSNKLEGEITKSLFDLRKLSILLLSSNKLSGIIRISDFQGRLSSLTSLDLSFNNLTIITSPNITLVSHLPKFSSLKLAACNLNKFPNLRNQTRLINLDLSDNKIEGQIPNWIWTVGNGYLSYMNLSHNLLTSLQEPHHLPDLIVLDLHFNHLSGVIPVPPQTATFIDYSENLFNSSLTESIGTNLSYAYFFSVSSNALTGAIPDTICTAPYLKVLDLSRNRLNGSIPRCLIESGGDLWVLNLANNNLNGQIEGTFPSTCGLKTLDLQSNYLGGKIPESLMNCSMLEVLNVGNNRINDTFPCSLGNITSLRVLVLRSNMFHGSVKCSQNQHNSRSKLQIVDIAFNSFSSAIPVHFFSQWGAMMSDENGKQSSNKHLSFMILPLNDLYYQGTVTVTVKGLELQLVKILTVFTSIDISSNRFSGEIPSTIGQLKALYLLNVSHNSFSGTIPSSMGNMSQLEALDMSSNRLTGAIPFTLTSLPFLSALNLSYNQLEGRIPTGNQFQTFEKSSYLGNKGLCGFPLTTSCDRSVAVPVSFGTSSSGFDWLPIFFGMGVMAGLLIVIVISCSVCKTKISNTSR